MASSVAEGWLVAGVGVVAAVTVVVVEPAGVTAAATAAGIEVVIAEPVVTDLLVAVLSP